MAVSDQAGPAAQEQAEWWTPFFSDFFPRLTGFGVDDSAIRREVDVIERLLALPQVARLLDIPCGRGRHAVEMAHRGHQVTGIDLSVPLLDQARTRAREAGISLDLHAMDMRELDWCDHFDGAYCYRSSIGYAGEADDLRFLRAVWKALRPGGRFVAELALTETILAGFIARDWSQGPGGHLLQERSYHADTARLSVAWTLFEPGGEKHEATSEMRLYSCREMLEMLGAAGFTRARALQDEGAHLFTQLGRRALVVAEKS